MLPEPGEDARAASARLVERIRAEIAAEGGWIPFTRYMELALYAPGLGYYAGGATKLGPVGDFATAPELGTLYARTLARQVAALLEPGEPVLEFGAGSGALAAALLDALPGTPYLILEASGGLAARQRERVGARARWIERLPERFRGVMIANEVLDAMPAHALAWRREGVRERGVSAALAWEERPAGGAVLEAARALRIAPPYESELGLAGRAWMMLVASRLERGALLVIDYGFPRTRVLPSAARRRHAHVPLPSPRARRSVLLARAAGHHGARGLHRARRRPRAAGGAEVLGYCNQAQFLVNCGITDVLAQEDAADAARYAPRAAEAQALLSPAEMGELFKVLAVGRGVPRPLAGFAEGERSHTL